MRLYINLSAITFGVTLGVWHFARQILLEMGTHDDVQLIGLASDPSSIPSDVKSIFNDLEELKLVNNNIDAVELLLHHFQEPVTQCAYVVIVHDLHLYDVPWKYGNPEVQHNKLEKLVAGAAAVITHFPRTYYDLPKVLSKVPNAFFLSLSPSMHQPRSASRDLSINITEKYKLEPGAPLILYPAQLQQHKNHLTLFKAIQKILQQKPKLKVVCCGSNSSEKITNRLHEALSELKLTCSVFLPGRVSDDELQALYERADLVVSPSLAEGGAYIAQEAIEQGKKVAVSAIRPALLHLRLMNAQIHTFDPLDIDAMTNVITAALDGSQRNTAAMTTIKSWTWSRAANQFVTILKWVYDGCKSGHIPPFADTDAGISIADNNQF